ncbi:sulfite exporter TauE/SafE family protein [Halopiger goleimassiliensis]|uniref:sulfite exporter TauE/SafE family protein n=1 Tax=Halopiger goleimassiliensis TaxID=1293048 RepID=UPI0006782596|nr:sulfite exporter TauE/SafE family protein [Halopiger goleimassiliensis]
MVPIPLEGLLALVAVSVLAGIGCTTIGAGGIFVTIALYLGTPLSSAEVAGTAHVLFVAVGIVGAVGYARSGELLGDEGRLLAILLSATSVFGALAGTALNASVSRRLFGVLLGVLTAGTGIVLVYRRVRELPRVTRVDAATRRGQVTFGAVGVVLGAAAGLVGIGGPVIAVPALVVLGVPMLVALGVAQTQAIFLSGFAAGGYAFQDAISVPFALVTGVPIVFGAVGGWVIAHRVDPDALEAVLGVVLLPTGLYLIV